jgi:lysozyme family protein
MDRNWKRSVTEVLASEGGYVNNPKDPGGPTNKGITLANFRAFIMPAGTIDDLKKLTDEQAEVCYRRQYWDAVMGSALPDGVDYAVFDFAVNSGPGRATKYLQTVVHTKIDGAIGPRTLEAAAAITPAVIINQLCDERLKFLRALPSYKAFGRGWESRVDKVRHLALSMIAQAPEVTKVVPVVQEVEKPVVPPKVEATSKRWLMWAPSGVGLAGALASGWAKFAAAPLETQLLITGVAVVGIVGLLVLGERIIRRAKTLIKEINAA